MDERKISDVVTYINIDSCKIIKIHTTDKRVKNTEKQTYQRRNYSTILFFNNFRISH